ncbi:hypothetical protein NHX12_032692 [Muraenolepis orangiensis]|uniref:Transcription factor E4F1 n=1 Tax=Muraenolepis orangiensis TaxID=630683 RepID=A0A9Q0E6U4_9TELE|nr:hypothetical protein NHX12_032692 [Muraenolepis orangiensis]
MNVESDHTAEKESERTDHGNAVAVRTTLGDEDEDVHKCGRCQSEFSTLDSFIQHKLLQSCKRPLKPREQVVVSKHAAQERRRTASAKANARVAHGGKPQDPDTADDSKQAYAVNKEGRYVCSVCQKTFKTTNILRTHLNTHNKQKNFPCELCGTEFRTKGSLIRHYRRHTDERPYRCVLCGLSFRESGALTRHLKSITPCTEKIRFHQYNEILVSKDGIQKSIDNMLVLEPPAPREDPELIHQVHFTVTEQVVLEQLPEEAMVATGPVGDNVICQAIINSGIGMETETTTTELSKLHKCPHCNRAFKGLNYLRFHIKSHSGYKPFKCPVCQKEFLTGYLLKKHMDVHVNERRYKCGECGKLYKTIGHVREHMRAHSDERPFRCTKCNKGYKTKNALQVHLRTHADDKPFVCQFCLRGFREKGSLVRHIRHHTGEKPYKCNRCGRGFAEHGTLNRHIRAKGRCQKDDDSKEPHDGSRDPHTVLVEFSSVVADTQEYIIGTPAEEAVPGEEVTLIQATENQMGNHIMRVVQEIVNQSRSAGGAAGRQIILRNTEQDEEGTSISDCGDIITIATPESLTKQVAMTLANAISDGTLMATTRTTVETADGTITVVSTAAGDEDADADAQQCVEVMEQQEQHQQQHQQQQQEEEEAEFVLSATEEVVEIQTVVV